MRAQSPCVVEAHDGTIALRNGAGGGAQVPLRLPLAT
jgi:signal transduction histidine kinase